PATVRHPVALLEIDWLVCRAPAGPVAGAASELMERSCLQRIIRLADYLTAIEFLHLRIEIESTALEQQHFESRISQLACDGDACRSGAHDAEIAVEDC